MIQRSNETYRHSSFLVTDHDNSRPRVVNGWELLSRVLSVNCSQVACGEDQPYQVWLWNPNLGCIQRLWVSVASHNSEDAVQTWEVRTTGDALVGEFETQLRRKARRSA